MALDRLPDMNRKATEIDDPVLLVHRVLYRVGRIAQMFREEDARPLSERRAFLDVMTGHNRADLHRLEDLL